MEGVAETVDELVVAVEVEKDSYASSNHGSTSTPTPASYTETWLEGIVVPEVPMDDLPTMEILPTETTPKDNVVKRKRRARKEEDQSAVDAEPKQRRKVEKSADVKRRGAPRKEEDPAQRLFRHSQRSMRHEAQGLSMKEVFCRSMSHVMEESVGDSLNPFSPTSGMSSPTSSLPWSPTNVQDITNRFLATVKTQQRQHVERLISKDVIHGSHGVKEVERDEMAASHMVEEELIIADGEDANWLPATHHNSSSSNLGTFDAGGDGGLKERSLLGADSVSNSKVWESTDGLSSRLPSYLIDSQHAEDERSQHVEEAETRAIVRRHEMWKLRTRHEKALRTSSAAASGSHADAQQNSAASPPLEDGTPHTTSTSSAVDTFAGFMHSPLLSTSRTSSVAEVIHQSKLTRSDITTIQRLNSFDATSTKRVVVFGTSSQNKE